MKSIRITVLAVAVALTGSAIVPGMAVAQDPPKLTVAPMFDVTAGVRIQEIPGVAATTKTGTINNAETTTSVERIIHMGAKATIGDYTYAQVKIRIPANIGPTNTSGGTYGGAQVTSGGVSPQTVESFLRLGKNGLFIQGGIFFDLATLYEPSLHSVEWALTDMYTVDWAYLANRAPQIKAWIDLGGLLKNPALNGLQVGVGYASGAATTQTLGAWVMMQPVAFSGNSGALATGNFLSGTALLSGLGVAPTAVTDSTLGTTAGSTALTNTNMLMRVITPSITWAHKFFSVKATAQLYSLNMNTLDKDDTSVSGSVYQGHVRVRLPVGPLSIQPFGNYVYSSGDLFDTNATFQTGTTTATYTATAQGGKYTRGGYLAGLDIMVPSVGGLTGIGFSVGKITTETPYTPITGPKITPKQEAETLNIGATFGVDAYTNISIRHGQYKLKGDTGTGLAGAVTDASHKAYFITMRTSI